MSYPYVTIPDFAMKAEKTLSLTKGLVLYTQHYVTFDQRNTWQNYTVQNGPAWVQESVNVQRQYDKYSEFPMEGFIFTRNIFGMAAALPPEGREHNEH